MFTYTLSFRIATTHLRIFLYASPPRPTPCVGNVPTAPLRVTRQYRFLSPIISHCKSDSFRRTDSVTIQTAPSKCSQYTDFVIHTRTQTTGRHIDSQIVGQCPNIAHAFPIKLRPKLSIAEPGLILDDDFLDAVNHDVRDDPLFLLRRYPPRAFGAVPKWPNDAVIARLAHVEDARGCGSGNFIR